MFDEPEFSVLDCEPDLTNIFALVFEHPCNLLKLLERSGVNLVDIFSRGIDIVEFLFKKLALKFFLTGNYVTAEE